VGGSTANFAKPGIEIGEHGLISLPLGLRDVDTIKKTPEMRHLILTQRNTWASQFRLRDPAWQKFLDNVVLAYISKAFAVKSASMKLRELLLHGPGSFVKRHEHFVTEPEIIGTILISLPSEA
jgi:hypothetical protein